MADISGWASRLLFPDRNKSEFDKFVQEVNDESEEHMSFQVSHEYVENVDMLIEAIYFNYVLFYV